MRRTISDWLTQAQTSDDPHQAAKCIEAAIELVDGCSDWRDVLRTAQQLAVPPAQMAQFANRTLEVAKAEHAIWGFRDVATTRVHLGDRDGATTALEACFEAFLTPKADPWALPGSAKTQGYEWVLLAEGFVATLGDNAAARRCLEAGREMARAHQSANDLTQIATAWAKTLDDRDMGVSLLLEAQGLATNDLGQVWTLANAWRCLGEPAAVELLLDQALATAREPEQVFEVARAWGSHGELDRAKAALVQAQPLITDSERWLELGEIAFDLKLGQALIREALGQAERLDFGEQVFRSRIAAAYSHWLEEDVGPRLGPRGVAPETLRRPARQLPGWETSASSLFEWLCDRITQAELVHISEADYGTGSEKYLIELRDICQTKRVPQELPMGLHEVLALTRWGAGESVNHVERAFSCLLLCLLPTSMDNFVTNGVILAESCMALDPEAGPHAARFFAWLATTTDVPEDEDDDDDDDDDDVDRTFALLFLYFVCTHNNPTDPRLAPLAHQIIQTSSWAFAREWSAESMRAEIWDDLINALDPGHPASSVILRAFDRLPAT